MYKVKEFRRYAAMWIPLVEKFGGTHHGYFLPKKSASDMAVALFSFPSLADYERYRSDLRLDPDCRKPQPGRQKHAAFLAMRGSLWSRCWDR